VKTKIKAFSRPFFQTSFDNCLFRLIIVEDRLFSFEVRISVSLFLIILKASLYLAKMVDHENGENNEHFMGPFEI